MVSQILILVMFMFSFVLALSAVFVAAPQISGDVESGIALAILTRPLSRADVVIGKWLGLVGLLTVYIAGSVGIELVGVRLITDYTPRPLMLIVYLVGETVVLMTLALLISTRLSGMTGGVIALGAYGISWLGGIAGAIGTAFQNATITHIGTATQLLLPTDGLWRGAVYSLEPAAIITVARAAGAPVAPPAPTPSSARHRPAHRPYPVVRRWLWRCWRSRFTASSSARSDGPPEGAGRRALTHNSGRAMHTGRGARGSSGAQARSWYGHVSSAGAWWPLPLVCASGLMDTGALAGDFVTEMEDTNG